MSALFLRTLLVVVITLLPALASAQVRVLARVNDELRACLIEQRSALNTSVTARLRRAPVEVRAAAIDQALTQRTSSLTPFVVVLSVLALLRGGLTFVYRSTLFKVAYGLDTGHQDLGCYADDQLVDKPGAQERGDHLRTSFHEHRANTPVV